MAITQAVCNSFKKELLDGDHSFKQTGGDTYKLALYTSSATLNSSTTTYPGDSTGGQVGNSGTYTQGGKALVNTGTSVASGVAITDFADLSFTGVTLTARGALIYNTTMGQVQYNRCCSFRFWSDKPISETLIFSFNIYNCRILRISG